MDFAVEMTLPSPPSRVWEVLGDVRRAAACVPGCESVEGGEAASGALVPLGRYRAVMRQRVGPFKLEAPVEIVVESVEPGAAIRARATGKDRLTGTSVNAGLSVRLAPAGAAGTRLGLSLDVQVSGRLATLGWPMIRQRTQDIVDEFGARLRAALTAPPERVGP